MPEQLVIIVGGDALAERVCADLIERGRRVNVLSDKLELRERVERCGATFFHRGRHDRETLVEAGIETACALLALDNDDRINLEAALEARAAHPTVRLVLRQFNRTLARKIAGQLTDCSVISLAAHSAATYAAAAVEPSCYFGLEFPTGSRGLVGFVRRSAAEADVAECTIAEAERRLGVRVLARNDEPSDRSALVGADDRLVLFGPIERFAQATRPLRTARTRFAWIGSAIRALANEFDPLLQVLFVAGVAVFAIASIFFSFALHLGPITAAYFVVATMTTVGYGDIALADKGDLLQVAGIALMVSGVVIANLSIAFVAAAFIRAQWTGVQGLRPIRDRGHVVVFGAGRVGTRVVDYLCELGAQVTVVELAPTAELLRRARAREISLLTGDGSLDETQDLANVGNARSTVVVTDDDANNLEIGLGARARQADIPVIMRVVEPGFADAIRTQFAIRRAFSPTDLAWTAFADLAGSDAARGRVPLAGTSFFLEERPAATGSRDADAIAAARPGEPARAVRGWDEVEADDVVLTLSRSVTV